ncbi:MAG: hypothetical protein OXI01_20660 [Albidovulum sp.]|nr:hypothetical protein [Albidovulum sp.]
MPAFPLEAIMLEGRRIGVSQTAFKTGSPIGSTRKTARLSCITE